MIKLPQHSRGFTLVELLIVLGLFTVVFALTNISLSSMIARSNSQEFAQTLMSDLSRQQSRAMTGETAAGSAASYGVQLEPTHYTLFEGSVFSVDSPTNTVVTLPSDLVFESIALPQQQLVFSEDSGEVAEFEQTQSSWVLRNTTTNTSQTFQVNKLGVLTQTP